MLFRTAALGAVLAAAALPAQAAPVLTTGLFGSPGTNPGVDGGFTALGGTTKESYGFEGIPNLSGQQIRFNALTGAAPGTFTFSVAKNTSFTWVSGRTYSFDLSYSGDATKSLTATVKDTQTNVSYSVGPYTATYGGVQSLIFRESVPQAGSGASGPTGSSIAFQNLKLDTTSFANSSALTLTSSTDRLINYFSISQYDFTQAWTLTGDVIMTFSGTPSGSAFGWQIKGFQDVVPTPAPEPATLALLGAGLLGLGMARRRRG